MVKVLKFVVILAWPWFVACSRSVPDKVELNIGIPISQSSLSGSQSLGAQNIDLLDIVILNLRESPTAEPRVFTFERNQDFANIQPGGTLKLSLLGHSIPVSPNTIIQYLGVFENSSTGALRLSYGDTIVNTTVNGTINANISAPLYGTNSGKVVRFGGRYVTNPTTKSGPSGALITYFQPPNLNRPLMAVYRSEMVEGWFSAFALEYDGVASYEPKFTYVLKNLETSSDQILWSNINSQSDIFKPIDPNSNIRRWEVSPYFNIYKRSVGYQVEPRPGGWIVGGHWSNGCSGCLDDTFQGARPGPVNPKTLEGYSLTQDLKIPFKFYDSNPVAHDGIRLDLNFSGYANSGSTVTSAVVMQPELLDSHSSDLFGFRGLFRVVEIQNRHQPFLKARLNSSSQVELEWGYVHLPAGTIDGATIFYRPTNFSYNFNTNNFSLSAQPSCFLDMINRGYVPIHEVSGPTTTWTAPGPYSNSSHSFAVCAYKNVSGSKRYYPSAAESYCVSGCGYYEEQFAFGNKVPGFSPHDLILNANTTFSAAPMNGVAARITDIVPGASPGEFILSHTSSSFSSIVNGPDHELLVHVTGESNNDCGLTKVGDYEFVQVVDTSADQVIVKSQNSFSNSILSNTSPSLLNQPASSDFCYLQMVRVVSLGNLQLTSGANLIAEPFNWSQDGGGLIALRVNGTLSFAGESNAGTFSILAKGAGYPGGAPSMKGNSRGGSGALSIPATGSGSSGSGTNSGGGGAGAIGIGGYGESTISIFGSLAVGYTSSMAQNNQVGLVFGSGGGGALTAGGQGGGAVFLAARKIEVRNNLGNSIDVSGNNGTNGHPDSNGGGGGAGSIHLYSFHISNTDTGGTGTLNLIAAGGAGGTYFTTSSSTGGGGGGGYIRAGVCDVSPIRAIATLSPGYDGAPLAVSGGDTPSGRNYAMNGSFGYVDNRSPHPLCQ